MNAVVYFLLRNPVLYILVLVLFLVIFDGAIVYFALRNIIRKETKKVHYGRLSAPAYFEMNVDKVSKKLCFLNVEGKHQGNRPAFNYIVHILYRDKDIAGLVRRVKIIEDRISLRIFVVDKVDTDKIERVTTLRKEYKNKEEELIYTDKYPKSIKKNIKDYLTSGFVLVWGMFMFIFGMYAGSWYLKIVGGLFIVAGIFMVNDTHNSVLTIYDIENLRITNDDYHIGQLDMYVTKDQNEHFSFYLRKKNEKKTLCYFRDDNKDFNDILAALKEMRERYTIKNVYLPLFERTYYVHFVNDDIYVVYNSLNVEGSNTVTSINCFENEKDSEVMKIDNSELRILSVEDIIKYTDDFNRVDYILLCGRDYRLTVDSNIYQKVKKYRDNL
ncbi:MAG: hypothetical protein Q4D13_05285 [Erysipelotrichaceae bacterium]|nr:hypothetical protein [Erysipelotrichaceae bacterium]